MKIERGRCPRVGFSGAPLGGLLDEIERRRYDVFTRRIELSRWRKICVTAHSLARHKLHALIHGS